MSSDDSELFGLRDIYLNITLVQTFGNGEVQNVLSKVSISSKMSPRNILCHILPSIVRDGCELPILSDANSALTTTPVFKRKTHKLLFVVVILMYIFATIQTCVHWAIIRNAFVTHGTSPDDTVNYLTQPTFTLIVLPATLLVANTFLADCVLVRPHIYYFVRG